METAFERPNNSLVYLILCFGFVSRVFLGRPHPIKVRCMTSRACLIFHDVGISPGGLPYLTRRG